MKKMSKKELRKKILDLESEVVVLEKILRDETKKLIDTRNEMKSWIALTYQLDEKIKDYKASIEPTTHIVRMNDE